MSNYKFKGVFIPSSVWLDHRLSPTQKFLLCEIDALSNGENQPCIASNNHFAKHLKSSVGSIKNMLTTLEKLGYIKRKFTDKKLRLGRKMWTNLTPSPENDTPSLENDTPRHSTMTPPSPENDTINTNTNTIIKGEEDEEENELVDTSEKSLEILQIFQDDLEIEFDMNTVNQFLVSEANLNNAKNKRSYMRAVKTALLDSTHKKHQETLENYQDYIKSTLPNSVNVFDMYEK